MRNIPRYEEYLALLIEFDYEDLARMFEQDTEVKVNPLCVCMWNPGGIAMSHLGAVVEWSSLRPHRCGLLDVGDHSTYSSPGYDSSWTVLSAHPWVSGV